MKKVVSISDRRACRWTPNIIEAISRHLPDMARTLQGVKLNSRILHDGESLGPVVDSVHVVVSGCLKKTRIDVAGDAHIDGFYYPGDMISTDTGEPGQCSVFAAYDTVCLASLPVCVLSHLDNTDLYTLVVSGLSDQLVRANTLSFYVTQKSAAVRLAWFLHTLWSRNAGASSASDNNDVYMPMPRADIASYLGLAAETVSREFTRLSQKSVIAVDKRTVHINRIKDLAINAHIASDNITPARALSH